MGLPIPVAGFPSAGTARVEGDPTQRAQRDLAGPLNPIWELQVAERRRSRDRRGGVRQRWVGQGGPGDAKRGFWPSAEMFPLLTPSYLCLQPRFSPKIWCWAPSQAQIQPLAPWMGAALGWRGEGRWESCQAERNSPRAACRAFPLRQAANRGKKTQKKKREKSISTTQLGSICH